MEYTTRIKPGIGNKPKELTGIYIGKIESGKPNGYGLFYYTAEVSFDIGICSGEWEDGNLKSGTNVKRKYMLLGEDFRSYVILSGEWGNGNFSTNPDGVEITEEFNSSTGEWEMKSKSEGIFQKEDYYLINGKEYNYTVGIVSEGEFSKIGLLYNGTAYDFDGNVRWTVVDGEIHYTLK